MSMFFDTYTEDEFKAKWGSGFKNSFDGITFSKLVPQEDNPKKKKTIRYVFKGESIGESYYKRGFRCMLWVCPHCDKILTISDARWSSD